MQTIGSLIQTGRSIHVKRSPPAALQPSGLSNRHCFGLFCEIGKRFQKAAIMFPAGIYYVQTRGLPCLYEQTCLSNSVCPLYVQTRGCASSVRAGFSLLTGSVIYAYRRAACLVCTRFITFSPTTTLGLCSFIYLKSALYNCPRSESKPPSGPHDENSWQGNPPINTSAAGTSFASIFDKSAT